MGRADREVNANQKGKKCKKKSKSDLVFPLVKEGGSKNTRNSLGVLAFFNQRNFAKKRNWKLKIQEWNDFGGFQLPEVSGGGQKKTKLSNIFGWFWVCSQRYRSMIIVVYFISGFIARFGTIFLRKVATFFYGRSPLWLQTKILWKKEKKQQHC